MCRPSAKMINPDYTASTADVLLAASMEVLSIFLRTF
jgi:hypothetical protein